MGICGLCRTENNLDNIENKVNDYKTEYNTKEYERKVSLKEILYVEPQLQTNLESDHQYLLGTIQRTKSKAVTFYDDSNNSI